MIRVSIFRSWRFSSISSIFNRSSSDSSALPTPFTVLCSVVLSLASSHSFRAIRPRCLANSQWPLASSSTAAVLPPCYHQLQFRPNLPGFVANRGSRPVVAAFHIAPVGSAHQLLQRSLERVAAVLQLRAFVSFPESASDCLVPAKHSATCRTLRLAYRISQLLSLSRSPAPVPPSRLLSVRLSRHCQRRFYCQDYSALGSLSLLLFLLPCATCSSWIEQLCGSSEGDDIGQASE